MMEPEKDCISKRPTGVWRGIASTEPFSTTIDECRSVTIKHKNKSCSRHRYFPWGMTPSRSLAGTQCMQTSKYSPEVGFQYDDITKTISSPAGGTAYRYTPNNTQMITYSTLECGRSCRSYIKAGTSSLNIAYCVISSAPGGRWEKA